MRFSVIIPVYNCADKLHISVDSILNQTFQDFELILVNDGSKDDSLNVCRLYAEKESRVKIIDQPNSGPAVARNNGLCAAEGEYIIFCDADDFMETEALFCADALIKKSRWDVIIFGYSDALIVDGKTNVLKVHRCQRHEYYSNEEFNQDFSELDSQMLTYPVWNKVYSANFINSVGARFPDSVSVAEDFIFNIQVYMKAEKVLVSEDCIYRYIHHPKSITSTFSVGKMEAIEFVYQYSIGTLAKWNITMANRLKNAYIRDISVFVNNMFNSESDLNYREKRKLVKKIMNKNSVSECINTMRSSNFRNRIVAFLLKMKMTDLLLLTGKIARL